MSWIQLLTPFATNTLIEARTIIHLNFCMPPTRLYASVLIIHRVSAHRSQEDLLKASSHVHPLLIALPCLAITLRIKCQVQCFPGGSQDLGDAAPAFLPHPISSGSLLAHHNLSLVAPWAIQDRLCLLNIALECSTTVLHELLFCFLQVSTQKSPSLRRNRII